MQARCTKDKQGRRIKRYPREDERREALREVMRQRQRLNRFSRRGLQAVKREFALLHVLAYNLSRAVALLGTLFVHYFALSKALWSCLSAGGRNFAQWVDQCSSQRKQPRLRAWPHMILGCWR
jgi:hypothetical protein